MCPPAVDKEGGPIAVQRVQRSLCKSRLGDNDLGTDHIKVKSESPFRGTHHTASEISFGQPSCDTNFCRVTGESSHDFSSLQRVKTVPGEPSQDFPSLSHAIKGIEASWTDRERDGVVMRGPAGRSLQDCCVISCMYDALSCLGTGESSRDTPSLQDATSSSDDVSWTDSEDDYVLVTPGLRRTRDVA